MATLPTTGQLIKQFGLLTKKSLGQNFLLNPDVTDRIASSVPNLSQSTLVEIGAGPGGLTRSLLEAGAIKVIAIERDTDCLEILQLIQRQYGERLEIVQADALGLDDVQLLQLHKAPTTNQAQVVANLPYNIATPLLFKWLQEIPLWSGFTLMFQQEVAERIRATPSTKAYGKLSIMAQLVCTIDKVCTLGPKAFSPPPKINSTVLTFRPINALTTEEFHTLDWLTNSLFAQRRKTLGHIFRHLDETMAKKTLDWLGLQELSEQLRPENLTPLQLLDLAHHLMQ